MGTAQPCDLTAAASAEPLALGWTLQCGRHQRSLSKHFTPAGLGSLLAQHKP